MELNDRRLAIHRQLRANDAGLADLYKAAVEMLYENTPIAWPRLVAHAVREIMNGLPSAVVGPQTVERGRVEYRDRVDDIARLWEEIGPPVDNLLPGEPSVLDDQLEAHVEISRDLARAFAQLVEEHRTGSMRNARNAGLLFTAVSRDGTAQVRTWVELQQWWVGKAHHPRGGGVEDDIAESTARFEQFESMLFGLVGAYPETKAGLDELLEETNG